MADREPGRPVLRLEPNRPPAAIPAIVAMCETLLERAKSGELRALATASVGLVEGESATEVWSEIAADVPWDLVVGVVQRLSWTLLLRQRVAHDQGTSL